MPPAEHPKNPKYLQVYTALKRDITAGRWAEGARLPSEAELVRAFAVSRITITRAVRDLQAAGLVERVAGSGTFIKHLRKAQGHSFGLLIPDLGETEIFEPICQGMMASPLARDHVLVWGSSVTDRASRVAAALNLCRQYIQRRLTGVFFAPLEHSAPQEEVNEKILHALDQAGIPVVLLDRSIESYPQPPRHDLVGIDNRRAGYIMTQHLLQHGCRRIAFVALPHSAATVDARQAGYREALDSRQVKLRTSFGTRLDPSDVNAVRHLLESLQPDAVVCANDRTAGHLLQSLRQLRYRVPQDIRITGIDDVGYAKMLPVPLTTLRQPTRDIGEVALSVMLERVVQKHLPPREVRLGCTLIVRKSCGAHPR